MALLKLVICGSRLSTVYFVDKLLHVPEAAFLLAFAIVLDRIKEHGHELHLIDLAQDFRLDVTAFRILNPLEHALVIGDAAARLNAARQGLVAHEV